MRVKFSLKMIYRKYSALKSFTDFHRMNFVFYFLLVFYPVNFTDCLQTVHKSAARLFPRTGRFNHIAPILASLGSLFILEFILFYLLPIQLNMPMLLLTYWIFQSLLKLLANLRSLGTSRLFCQGSKALQ